MRRLLVLPTYQEAANVSVVLRRIREADPGLDVLVVDDGSPDGTAELARAEARHLGGVEVICRDAKGGLGSAYRTGFARGVADGYEVLLEMDADLSHDPADLPRLIAAISSGADLVIGSRYVPGGAIPAWSWYRRALSRWGNRYAARMLGLQVADATSGFRAYRAGVLARIDLSSLSADGYGFQIEMVRQVAAASGRIEEIPIAFADRTRGRSKMSGAIVAEALMSVTWWGIVDLIGRLRRGRVARAQRARC